MSGIAISRTARAIAPVVLTLALVVVLAAAGTGQAQKTVKIFMVPKFTGAAYFAATEKGDKEAVAELKGKGVAIDFLYTGPSVANTDEEIRMIDDLIAQKPAALIIPPTTRRRSCRWPRKPRRRGSPSSPTTPMWPIRPRATGL